MNLDPEIVEGFKEESELILGELVSVVERLEEAEKDFPSKDLEEFSQKIDRIMGAAKTIAMEAPDHQGLIKIGRIAELCKALGYEAAKTNNTSLIPIFAAFWADTIEVVEELVSNLENEEATNRIAKSFSEVLQKRLEWLSGRLNKPAQSGDAAAAAQLNVDDLLKQFGI